MVTANKNKSVISLLLMCIITINISAIKPPPGKFKNLKILPKDISEDSLDTVMHRFKDALGVKCSFCHVKDANDPKHLDFASDDKDEKEIARHMMRMTMDINAKYFNFKDSPEPEKNHANF